MARSGLPSRALAAALVALLVGAPLSARAEAELCPEARLLPQLTIDKIQDPAVPVIDNWQIFWGTVPMSDYQLASLAGDDVLIDRTRREMQGRGTWVYIGTLMAAAGTAVSSAGWVLFGQDKQPSSVTLPMAIGGILLGAAGLLTITHFVQTPIEPLIAPTPEHRLTREEVRSLVARVNQQLYRDICRATASRPPDRADESAAK